MLKSTDRLTMCPEERLSELFCVVLCTEAVHSHKYTQMSSSYSSPEWVLSHWAHFTVRRFICVYLSVFCVFFVSYCICVVSLIKDLSSFSALILLVGSFSLLKPVPDMTYNVFGGTLNLAQSNPYHSAIVTT